MSRSQMAAMAGLFVVSMVLVAQSVSADAADAERLPWQGHNRMLFIETEGKDCQYVDMPGHYDVGSPSISRDGKWIALDAETIGRRPVRESWLVGADGKGLRKLADGATPRWSPDGSRLLITRDVAAERSGNIGAQANLFEYELAGGKERKICGGRFGDYSPDGSRIAFARSGQLTANGGTHTGSKIFIAKADGTEAQELGDGDWPSWSPDGKKIACCVHEELRVPALWIVDVESKTRKKLGYGYYRAQWAGDGKSVLCNAFSAVEDEEPLLRDPGRFWLDKPLQPVFFHTDLDNPFSPCVSQDGKTMVLVVDSQKRAKPPAAAADNETL